VSATSETDRSTAARLATAALGLVGLAAGALGVIALREATMSTHSPVPPDSRVELVVEAASRGGDESQTVQERVDAQVRACRLEVASDLVDRMEPVGDGRYRGVLAPAMDETDRRQFRGCLEDWVIDNVRLDIEVLRDLG
jgi:hypothetical protein